MQELQESSCSRCKLQSQGAHRAGNSCCRDLPRMWLNETLSGGEGETSQKKKIEELKRRSVEKKPTVWIGKSGVTNALLGQISRQLDANEIIKVKVHKTSLRDTEVDELADKITEETTCKIVDVRGRTFTLYKPKKARKVGPKPTG